MPGKKTLKQRIRKWEKVREGYHRPIQKTTFKVGDIWEIPRQLDNYPEVWFDCRVPVDSNITGWIKRRFVVGCKFFLFAKLENNSSEIATDCIVFSVLELTTNTKHDIAFLPSDIKMKTLKRVSKG